MTPEAQNPERHQRRALEALVADNPDLERLEFLANRFNIFEAVGAVRQEIRHSDFLAYLLNPRQNHGLGDAFARKLLQRAVSLAPQAQAPITPIELDTWDLAQLEVLTEWHNIDIMLRSAPNHLSVVIENKIDTTEHPGQLESYYATVRTHWPSDEILGIYLTPEGDTASHKDFLPLGYEQVAAVIESLAESRASSLGPDVRTLMSHYTHMLRRQIVAESEIAELCLRIYRKHRDAIDLIIEHQPDQQADLREFLEGLIKSAPELFEPDDSTKRYVRFAFKKWDIPALKPTPKPEKHWTSSGRMLIFEFQNKPSSLKLKLVLGPGPEATRNEVFRIALLYQPPFKPAGETPSKWWNEIYTHDFLSERAYAEAQRDELEAKIREQWKHFLETDLPSFAKFKWTEL